MGCLRHVGGAFSFLEAEHLIGRSPLAVLRIDESYVSAQHALICWTGSSWELKDLGSRNGTLLNEVAIKPAQATGLMQGSRVSFGSEAQTWELIDASPPRAMVVPLDQPTEPLFIEGDMLALPSPSDPRDTVFRASDGAWHLEREDRIVALESHFVFESSGRHYRFSCPDVTPDTSAAGGRDPTDPDLDSLRVVFRVSRDEEHVEVVVERRGESIELGSRVHNYPLLLLARQRLSDAANGMPERSCGWVYLEEFVRSLKVTPERVNMDVYRIRRQFAALGVPEPARIIERRPRTRQLRIGTGRLALETI
jgi:hypothetical protein